MTPIGPQWQAESQRERPAVSADPYASYNPQGRTEQSFYQRPTSEEEDLFGGEFGSVLGDALKGNQGPVAIIFFLLAIALSEDTPKTTKQATASG